MRGSRAQRQIAGEVMVHEISHQWLGNLASLDTWNHIWIYEALAAYLDNVGVAEVGRSLL